MTVRIVTDSACDLRGDEVEAFGIEVVGLSIRFGDTEYVDRDELAVADFYRLLAESDTLPETAAPSPGQFTEAFRRQLDAGADAVVCINMSAALSATMQSAQTAADGLREESPDIDIRVIDSCSITAGSGRSCSNRRMAEEASADEIEQAVAAMSSRTRVFGALDTLEYLKKGGRIGGAQALVGSMLAIKPILDLSSGSVEEAAKQRTRKKALAWLRDQLVSAGPVEHLAVMHGAAPDTTSSRDDRRRGRRRSHPRRDDRSRDRDHGGPRVMGLAYQLPAG
ncbi:MAG: DegV family protein [Acidimicrobiales bacterium]